MFNMQRYILKANHNRTDRIVNNTKIPIRNGSLVNPILIKSKDMKKDNNHIIIIIKSLLFFI